MNPTNSFAQLLIRARQYLVAIGWVIALLETVLALVAGGLIGAALSGGAALPAVVSCLVYLVFFSLKLYGQSLFPASLFGELEAQQKLERTQSDLNRQNQMFGYVNQSIISLNKQTCSVSIANEPRVCNESVADGLKDLLAPIIEHPQYVLNCQSNKFTVAVRVEHYVEEDGDIGFSKRIYVFRDDLGLKSQLDVDADGNDAIDDIDATGIRLKLRNALQASFNDNAFHSEAILAEEMSISLAVSPIPLVCAVEDASGVLMVATDADLKCPCDLPDVLRIYGRLTANWLSKHDECLGRKFGYYDVETHGDIVEPDSLDDHGQAPE
ncbi:hypothetical protein SH139x_002235 [Planctomycetaceae bacterium SH139]